MRNRLQRIVMCAACAFVQAIIVGCHAQSRIDRVSSIPTNEVARIELKYARFEPPSVFDDKSDIESILKSLGTRRSGGLVELDHSTFCHIAILTDSKKHVFKISPVFAGDRIPKPGNEFSQVWIMDGDDKFKITTEGLCKAIFSGRGQPSPSPDHEMQGQTSSSHDEELGDVTGTGYNSSD